MTTQCPRWATLNGPCPQDVFPSGEHVCSVVSPTHAKCRCACGVETLRSFAEREVARHEGRIGRASITVDEKGSGRVVVGLTDISSHVNGGTVEFKAGEPTRLKVGMPCVALAARGDIELDEETAKALELLGWSGPDTELLRRRDLADALGVADVVLPDWETLISAVQMMASRLEGLDR